MNAASGQSFAAHVLSLFCLHTRHNNVCCADVCQNSPLTPSNRPRPGKQGIHNMRRILYSTKYYTFRFCTPIVNFSEQAFFLGNSHSANESRQPSSCVLEGTPAGAWGIGHTQWASVSPWVEQKNHMEAFWGPPMWFSLRQRGYLDFPE